MEENHAVHTVAEEDVMGSLFESYLESILNSKAEVINPTRENPTSERDFFETSIENMETSNLALRDEPPLIPEMKLWNFDEDDVYDFNEVEDFHDVFDFNQVEDFHDAFDFSEIDDCAHLSPKNSKCIKVNMEFGLNYGDKPLVATVSISEATKNDGVKGRRTEKKVVISRSRSPVPRECVGTNNFLNPYTTRSCDVDLNVPSKIPTGVVRLDDVAPPQSIECGKNDFSPVASRLCRLDVNVAPKMLTGIVRLENVSASNSKTTTNKLTLKRKRLTRTNQPHQIATTSSHCLKAPTTKSENIVTSKTSAVSSKPTESPKEGTNVRKRKRRKELHGEWKASGEHQEHADEISDINQNASKSQNPDVAADGSAIPAVMNVVEKERTNKSSEDDETSQQHTSRSQEKSAAGESKSDNTSTKSYIKYASNVNKVLANLNEEMSSALRSSFFNIDEISLKVRQCLTEMDEHDRYYSKVRVQSTPNLNSPPVPQAIALAAVEKEKSCELSDNEEVEDNRLVPIQTQSENQTRIVAEIASGKTLDSFAKGLEEFEKSLMQCYTDYQKNVKTTGTCQPTTSSAMFLEPKPMPVILQNDQNGTNNELKDGDQNVADVPKAKPLENIHEKLIKQLQATDSLLEFEKHMQRMPDHVVKITAEELYVPEKNINKIISKKALDSKTEKCSKMITKVRPRSCGVGANSSGKTIKSPKAKPILKSKTRCDIDAKYPDSLWFSKSKPKCSGKAAKDPDKCENVQIKTERPVASTLDTSFSKQHGLHLMQKRSKSKKRSLYCFDLLDELTCKDVEPIQSEYPRKDFPDPTANVENTYLYKLVYGKNVDCQMMELFGGGPSVHCSAANCPDCSESRAKVKNSDLQDGKKADKRPESFNEGSNECCNNSKFECTNTVCSKRLDGKGIKKNEVSFTNKSIGAGKVKIPKFHFPAEKHAKTTVDRKTNRKSPSKRAKKKSDKRLTATNNATGNLTGSHVIEKLKPYLKDPQLRYPTTITVMPVKVSYSCQSEAHALVSSTKNNKTSTPPRYFFTTCAKKTESAGDGKKMSKSMIKYDTMNKSKTLPPSEKKNWTPRQGKSTMEKFIVRANKSDSEKKIPVMPQLLYRRKSVTAIPNAANAPKLMKTAAKTPEKQMNTAIRAFSDMKTLAGRKHAMGNNIQQVIETIEMKIVNVLMRPNGESAGAFDAVEKEITNVLTMMRNMSSPSARKQLKANNMDLLRTKLEMIESIEEAREASSASRGPPPEKEAAVITSEEIAKANEVVANLGELTGDQKTSPSQKPLIKEKREFVAVESEVISDEVPLIRQPEDPTAAIIPPNTAPNEENPPSPLTNLNTSEKSAEQETAKPTSQQDFDRHLSNNGNVTVTDTCPPEVTNDAVMPSPQVTENEETIKIDEFLTPFMHAIKQIRNNEPSQMNTKKNESFCDIIQFLETLTDMREENRAIMMQVGCRVNKSVVFEQASVYYLVKQYYPIKLWDVNENLLGGNFAVDIQNKITVAKRTPRNFLIKLPNIELYNTKEMCKFHLPSLELSKIFITESKSPAIQQPNSLMCLKCLSTTKENDQPEMEIHKLYVLNTVYAVVFTLMYVALAMNFCF